MAEPKFHDYEDMLGDKPKQQFLKYDQLMERTNIKKRDKELTKIWIEDEASITQYSIVASEGLALAEHYGNMKDVEIDPEVTEFYKSQKEELDKIDVKSPQTDYMHAYSQYQDIVESLDDRKRDELGTNNYYDREKKAREGISKAKERYAEAKNRVANLSGEINTFKAFFGMFFGSRNKEAKQLQDAYKGVEEAHKGIAEARKNLKQVQESKKASDMKLDSLLVKKASFESQMEEALETMQDNRKTAKLIIEGGENGKAKTEEIRKRLAAQYELIDKYKAIQKFKNDPKYISFSKEIKQNGNQDEKNFIKKLETLPTDQPTKKFKVTLTGPIQIINEAENILEIESKIKSVKNKLPNYLQGQSLEDLPLEIDALEIVLPENNNPTDTINAINGQISNLKTIISSNPTSKEAQQAVIKKDYLEKKKIFVETEDKINTLQEKYFDALQKGEDYQPILKELSRQKQILKNLPSLENHLYIQTLNNLKEIQQLLNQRTELKSLETVETTSTDILNSQLNISDNTSTPLIIGEYFKTFIDKITEQTALSITSIVNSHEKTPVDYEYTR